MNRTKKLLIYFSLLVIFTLFTMTHSPYSWSNSPSHLPLPVHGVEIIGRSLLSCDAQAYIVSINNTSDYYVTGCLSIEKEINGNWYTLNISNDKLSHLLFQNGIDGLAVNPYSSNSCYLDFNKLLPKKSPGKYRVVWTGFAKKMNQNIQIAREDGCLFFPFTLT